MQQAVKTPAGEHRLTLTEVLDWLVEDRMVDADAAAQLKKERRYYRGAQHPLVAVAEQKWKSLAAPQRVLSLDALAEHNIITYTL